jgi:hypothetical protein
MRKILGVVVLCFFIFNTSSNAGNINGKGELKMSNQSVENFIYYIKINKKLIDGKRPKPEAFLISQDGSWSWYFYCTWNDCRQNDKVKIEECERITEVTCGRFAIRRTIYWDNGINTKKNKAKFSSKMSDTEIRAKLTELGFIGNTSTTKKDNYDYPSLIAKQRSVHKSNWKDYVDYNNKYKAFVMAITKTKNDMTLGWQTDDTSWNDVIKKSFDRCNKYIKQKPKNYPKDSICILYYKGTKPTTDKEKIETAQKYYSKAKVEKFFKKYPDVLNDGDNSLLKKSIITKKTTSSDDIVSKLKDLKELLDTGVLSKEEFEKAKKKLLN